MKKIWNSIEIRSSGLGNLRIWGLSHSNCVMNSSSLGINTGEVRCVVVSWHVLHTQYTPKVLCMLPATMGNEL